MMFKPIPLLIMSSADMMVEWLKLGKDCNRVWWE